MKNKIDLSKIIRPCCAGFQPYVAGKPIETIKREFGLKKVIKLASNENPLGPSKKAVNAVIKAAGQVFYYPDSNSWALKQSLSEKYGVKTENIMLGAGSDEIIELLAKAFFMPKDNIVVSEHAFIRYRMAGELMGCGVVAVPMKDYTHDLSAMAEAVTPETKAVFIANPNNPTGTYNSLVEVTKFLKRLAALPSGAPLVIMDEAYYEYARKHDGYPETLELLSRYPNLIILRTFSKIYGLAGLRVGYGFASREIVDFIERIRPPFNINYPAQEAAAASLKDPSQVKKCLSLVQKETEYLIKELNRMKVNFVPSAANFLLIEVKPFSGKDIFNRLLKKGIIVRALDEYEYPSHIRVTVGLPGENRLFIKQLEIILKNGE